MRMNVIRKLSPSASDNKNIAALVNHFLAPITTLNKLIEKIDAIHDELFPSHHSMRLLLAQCDIAFQSIEAKENALKMPRDQEYHEPFNHRLTVIKI